MRKQARLAQFYAREKKDPWHTLEAEISKIVQANLDNIRSKPEEPKKDETK